MWLLLARPTGSARCWDATTKEHHRLLRSDAAAITRLPACDYANEDVADASARGELRPRVGSGRCGTTDVDMLVFLHNQKAGGTTVKGALIELCRACESWVCWFPDGPLASLRRWTEALVPSSLRGAGYIDRWFALPQHARNATRVLFGDRDQTIAACHFVDTRCVYAINVREPLSQMISHYNYFCVDGAEGQHKWSDAQRAQGYCDAGFERWSVGAIPLVPRLSGLRSFANRSVMQAACRVAVSNVLHPCMWAMLVDDFASLIGVFGRKLGAPWSAKLLGTLKAKNTNAGLHPRRRRHLGASQSLEDGKHLPRARRIQKAMLVPIRLAAMRERWARSAVLNTTFIIHEKVARASTKARWERRPLLTC